MTEGENQLEYASPQTKPAQGTDRRPLRVWVQLLLVWAIGLMMWTAYLVAIVYMLLRLA